MLKELSIIIPSRPNIDNIAAILSCLKKQTFTNFIVYLVIDSVLNKESYQELKYSINKLLYDEESSIISQEIELKIVSNMHYDFVPKKNASATRNYGIQLANTPFIYLFDDDNLFNNNHIKKTIELYDEFQKKLETDLILTGTLIYRKTGNIQNQGFKRYNYRMSRPEINYLKEKKRDTIRMYSGNGLFGPTHIFQDTLYDENLDFVAEDLDLTYRISKNYPIIVHSDLKVYHMEREKTYLESKWIGNEFGAYRKAKHKIIFAKKHANGLENIAFWGLGFWGSSVWLIAQILISHDKKKWKIFKNFLNGIRDGIKYKI